jgi:hypothetical protein
MLPVTNIIHEKSHIIPIKQNLSTTPSSSSPKGTYNLNKGFFDPSKSSPPNDFMIKLHMRMNTYAATNYADSNR